MDAPLVNEEALRSFRGETFLAKRPFPWHAFQGFLTTEGFQRLCREFPPLEFFEKHEDLPRGYSQRPHNRYYLSYETTAYHPAGYQGPGVARQDQLPAGWRAFVRELEEERYRGFLQRVFGAKRLAFRYAWHVGFAGSEVSPHRDIRTKAGLHLFYFNPEGEWDPAWGGEVLLLGRRKRPVNNPDFADFAETTQVPIVGNVSLLLRNTPEAWHGVRPLICSEGKYRRLFSVIAQRQESPGRKVLRLVSRAVGRKPYPGEK